MIRERCSCGAEIEIDEPHPLRILNAWRKEHVCSTPVEQRDSSKLSETQIQIADGRIPELHIGFQPQEEG